jgi:predicted phage terminase large subunit-like protein
MTAEEKAANGLPLGMFRLGSPDAFAVHASRGRWISYRHLRDMSALIATAIVAGGGRIIVSMPPRHGKSEMISHWLPVWYLNLFPEKRVILTSYGDRLARFFGRKIKNEMATNQEVSANVKLDSKASDELELREGGGMFTSGIGGAITGRGADLIIVDDPIKTLKEAMSPVVRASQVEWFQNVLYTRLEPGGSIIVVLTRWHEDDMAGWLTKHHEDDWTVINLPAIAEDNDQIGREPGEPLCPERFSLSDLTKIRAAIGSRAWASLYQGRPAPQEGAIWKRQNWKRWTELPSDLTTLVQTWDMTQKEGGTSYVVGQVWGKKGAARYLIDQIRGKWGFSETLEKFRQLTAKWPKAERKLVEAKANGAAIEDQLKKEIHGIILVEPKGGKEVRAMACEPELEAGNVFVPADEVAYPWVVDFIEEAAVFPNGANDDMVDAASQALNWFKTSGEPVFAGRDRTSPQPKRDIYGMRRTRR